MLIESHYLCWHLYTKPAYLTTFFGIFIRSTQTTLPLFTYAHTKLLAMEYPSCSFRYLWLHLCGSKDFYFSKGTFYTYGKNTSWLSQHLHRSFWIFTKIGLIENAESVTNSSEIIIIQCLANFIRKLCFPIFETCTF